MLAIEPMFTAGTTAWSTDADGWTIRTGDGSLAAHWEHTVAIEPTGTRVLTALPGEVTHLPLDAVAT